MSRAPSPADLTPEHRVLVRQLEDLGVDPETIAKLVSSAEGDWWKNDPLASDSDAAFDPNSARLLDEPEPTWAELGKRLYQALAWHAGKLFRKG